MPCHHSTVVTVCKWTDDCERGSAHPVSYRSIATPDRGELTILTKYIDAAMRHAAYEDLGDEGWYGHLPGLDGLWASAPTLEEARQELRSTLEDWLLIGIRLGHQLPVVDGLDLNVRNVA